MFRAGDVGDAVLQAPMSSSVRAVLFVDAATCELEPAMAALAAVGSPTFRAYARLDSV